MTAALPRIVVDARPLTHPQPGGFRTYVRALLRGLQERGTNDVDLLLYIDREPTDADRAFLPPHATVRLLSPARLRTDLHLFRQAVRQDRPDLVHGTMNYLPSLPHTIPVTVTIHDALGIRPQPWDHATPRTPRERFIHGYWAHQTARTAALARRIITDSHSAAAELAAALRLPRERFAVVSPGVVSSPPPAPFGGALSVGTSVPRDFVVPAVA
ncbi:MAG: glycosyltransferase, partial [Cytophagales bacterium]|nr:glycosyltransferase [Armatimonadota bacterium]